MVRFAGLVPEGKGTNLTGGTGAGCVLDPRFNNVLIPLVGAYHGGLWGPQPPCH